jgi:SAM-dependent methyltransferase
MAGAEAYNAWLFERAAPHLGTRVLDAGAGLGTFTELAARGREVVAVEPDGACLSSLRRRFAGHPGVTIVAGDATQLEAEMLGTFDSILCFNVLEHIRDDGEALASFRALLRPGGRLLLLVPAHPALYGETDRTVGHERRYAKEVLRRRLASAGLTVDELRHVNPVGALGWLVSARILRRRDVPAGPLRLYDRLVPVLRVLDAVPSPFGLSLWAVARA